MPSIRIFNGHTPITGKDVFIDESAVVTGQVTLGDHVSVWPQASLRGDLLPITIGHHTNLQDGVVIHTTQDHPRFSPGGHATTVGNYVIVGHKAMLHGCTIHDHSLIGMGAIILDGAVVESHVIVAAGSIVPPGKTLKSGYLWRGTPVKQARPLTEDEMAYFEHGAKSYVDLKNKHMKLANKNEDTP